MYSPANTFTLGPIGRKSACGGQGVGMFDWFRRKPEQMIEPETPLPEPPRPQPVRQPLPQTVAVPVEEFDHRPSIVRAIEAAKATRRKWMTPDKIALKVVAWIRENDWHTYPYLSKDLDEQIEYWCSENGVHTPDFQSVREYIPGEHNHVRHHKERLNRNNPRHQFLIQRMEARGKTEPRNGWRMWVYYIDDVPGVRRAVPRDDSVVPAKNRPKPKAKPEPLREFKPHDWSAPLERVRDAPAHGVDDFVIGEEIEIQQPRRRYA